MPMLGDKYKPLIFPPQVDYSIERLREYSENHYEMLIGVIEYMAVEEMGEEDFDVSGYVEHINFIMKTGLIKPFFVEYQEHEATVMIFKTWSLFNGGYISAEDLEDAEAEVIDHLCTRMFHVN